MMEIPAIDPLSIRKSSRYAICLMHERGQSLGWHGCRGWTIPDFAPPDPVVPWDWPYLFGAHLAFRGPIVDRLLAAGLVVLERPQDESPIRSVRFVLSDLGVRSAVACGGWWADVKSQEGRS